MKKQHYYTVMHWGTWQVESREGEIVAVKPVPWDKNPSRIGQSLPDAVTSQTRIRRPAVRAGYLQHGPASREGRGKEPFVEVSWEVATDLLARELRSVKARCGNEAIYGGSYGWASAGRFHHAQSQLHRFLKGFGGYTASTNTYSSAAGERILPHILGPLSPLHRQHTHFSELAGVSAVCRHRRTAAAQCQSTAAAPMTICSSTGWIRCRPTARGLSISVRCAMTSARCPTPSGWPFSRVPIPHCCWP
ncbi:hypothetical protein KPZU09_30450 [Klebsiella pneumoniae]|uniref:Biotin sulfoxide reductase n=1 Tax=Klebsiella pneumoniae TaxID=573 RepID=A0A919LSX7_KLEPN|nr:hypothetical protein KPZU09_30450 [Klebsiella pneumoniae]